MLWRGKGHKSPGSGGLSEEVGAIFNPQESGGETILGMVMMLGAHSFERFRRLSSGGMKPKTIFAGAGVWREMRICIGIFFILLSDSLHRGKRKDQRGLLRSV